MKKFEKFLIALPFALSPIAFYNIVYFIRVYSQDGKFVINNANIYINALEKIILVLTLICLIIVLRKLKEIIATTSDTNKMLNVLFKMILEDHKEMFDKLDDSIKQSLLMWKCSMLGGEADD